VNPSPRYLRCDPSDLPADTEFSSLVRFKLGSYEGLPKEPVAAAPSNPKGRLDTLVLRRIIAAIGAKKHSPSFATPSNQLTLTLANRIENCAAAVLHLSRQETRNRLRELEPNIPKKEQTRFLRLLREARAKPISADDRSRWPHLLTEVAIILDPVDRFPALDRIRVAKGPRAVKGKEARFRSGLLNFFNKTLKNLLG
jgi:hypothetical protein